MMENTKMMSPAEMLKNEIMERYGLREDQVRLELTISTIDLELGRTILADFDKHKEGRYLPEKDACDSVFGNTVHFVTVHRKDGRYGQYIVGDSDE